MRLFLAIVLAGSSFAVGAEQMLAPNSATLHKLFGYSNLVSADVTRNWDRETISLPGHIQLTVLYGSDNRACLITLDPQLPDNHLMSSKRVSEALDAIAPIASRGKPLGGGTFCGGSPGIVLQEYQNVSIRRWFRCGEPESESKAILTFKRDVCQKPGGWFR